MITYNNETLVITHHTPNKPPWLFSNARFSRDVISRPTDIGNKKLLYK